MRCQFPIIVIGCLSVAACALTTANTPAPELPQVYAGESATAGVAPPDKTWYREFASDELTELVEHARNDNLDLAAAKARVTQADLRARQAGAALLPSVDANLNGNYLAGHSEQGGGHELDWSAMLSASYEVDFWGKNRATADSARWLAGASRADREALSLTVDAGVANTFFQILGIRERLGIATLNRDTAQRLLDAVQARFDAGAANPVDLATQKTAFDTAQIAISDLQQMETENLAALALLLGRLPEKFELKTKSFDSLSEPVIGAGLPSELLRRRPDLVVAEANLRAGRADLVAARAALFPSLNLTASAGVQNPALPATILTIPGIGPSFALGAGLVQPIFNHGRLLAQRDEVQAKNTELLTAYRAAIIAAFGDVENALAAIQHLNGAKDFQTDNVAQSERAFEGAKLRYEAGAGDFLTLLEAQRTVYVARDQFVQYKLARFAALVSLNKALGGGWTTEMPLHLANNNSAGDHK